jgi:hypothetical protein
VKRFIVSLVLYWEYLHEHNTLILLSIHWIIAIVNSSFDVNIDNYIKLFYNKHDYLQQPPKPYQAMTALFMTSDMIYLFILYLNLGD